MRAALALCCAAVAGCAAAQSAVPYPDAGPRHGTLFIAGGGNLGPDLIGRFVDLAGGPGAHVVVIPTAANEDSFPDNWPSLRMLREAGAAVTVLHTRSKTIADSREFVEPLRSATGVWIAGGRQWRLADAYNDTRTLDEIRALLDRGGVVGGTSAGASIQASYMVRGAVESNTIMMAPGHETGFGLLRNTAIDQHLTARGREEDMLEVVRHHPALLGIGIDEGTALIVSGDRASIAGRGRVAFYNTADADELDYYFLSPGDSFDLAGRRTLAGDRIPPAAARDEAAVIATMNALFDAMRARDTAAIRALAHPELRIYVPFSRDDRADVNVSTIDEFMSSIAAAADRLDERPVRPEVRVDGPLASIWTRYTFTIGSRFSHCGTDAFHFVRTADRWIITALAYTVQRNGCTR